MRVAGDDAKVGAALGRQLRRIRKRKGWTQQQLSAELDELGFVVHPTAILKIEKGTRAVTVDEWLGLAAALSVPPPLLLLPLGSEHRVEITQKSRIHPHLALEWVTGDECLPSTERKMIRRGEWLQASRPLRLYRQFREIWEDKLQAVSAVSRARAIGDADQIREAERGYADALERLHGHLERMVSEGVDPPGQTRQAIADMKVLGLDVDALPRWDPPADAEDADVSPVLAKEW